MNRKNDVPERASDTGGMGSDWRAAWETEDNYWNENFSSRPYSLGPDYYDQFRPAYRYGFESAHRHANRPWDEVEPELRRDWDRYEHGGRDRSAWETIKDAVRDAFDRARRTPPGTHLAQ